MENSHCRRSTALAAGFAVFLFGIAVSDATLVLQPSGVSTDMGEFYPALNAINQSGLSPGYTSLVTDFDEYIGPTDSHAVASHGFGANVWGSTPGRRSGNFDLSLGETYVVSAIALWTLAFFDPSTIREFNITLGHDPEFTSSTTYTGFLAANTAGNDFITLAQVYRFEPTPASYLRLEILNTWSDSSYAASFNEIAIGVVPEPGSAALLAYGLFGLFAARRRSARR